jgi:hypothetical protein
MSKNNQLKSSKQAIEWRRDIVLTRLSQGYSQSQIAAELHLHKSTISLDCKFLSEQAQENLRVHIQETVPFDHLKVKFGLNQVLQKVWEIANNSEKTDERLRAYALIDSLYAHLSSTSTESTIISKAMDTVRNIICRIEQGQSDQVIQHQPQEHQERMDKQQEQQEVDTTDQAEQEQSED